jgi:mono/diheme cytochrome c family protein
MKRPSSSKSRLPAGILRAVAVAAAYGASLALVTAADPAPKTDANPAPKTDTNPAPKTDAKPVKSDKKAETKTTKKLTGAELYAVHCNRCHAERYPTEFTSAQWKTIVMEMRVRANLPASQAKAILKYLEEEAGTP